MTYQQKTEELYKPFADRTRPQASFHVRLRGPDEPSSLRNIEEDAMDAAIIAKEISAQLVDLLSVLENGVLNSGLTKLAAEAPAAGPLDRIRDLQISCRQAQGETMNLVHRLWVILRGPEE
jgi:hypothetical protein